MVHRKITWSTDKNNFPYPESNRSTNRECCRDRLPMGLWAFPVFRDGSDFIRRTFFRNCAHFTKKIHVEILVFLRSCTCQYQQLETATARQTPAGIPREDMLYALSAIDKTAEH